MTASKRVDIIGFSSAKGLVELTCCIVKKAVSLEHLVLNTLRVRGVIMEKNAGGLARNVLEEAFRAVAAIISYIQDEVPPRAKLTVVEPCSRSIDQSRSI
uniref:At1g61320/AtMIF1 LRR domain-containing protein n=1 Tax=Oryza punctata TaxID=4537 RepID=A0A0E0KY11_ORYPU